MSDFEIVFNRIDSSGLVYEGPGDEPMKITFDEKDNAGRELEINRGLLSERWMYYYTEDELNDLKTILKLDYDYQRGMLSSAVHKMTLRRIDLEPIFKYNAEYTVCFAYKEVGKVHYKCWVIGVLKRNMTRDEFQKRAERIHKYYKY